MQNWMKTRSLNEEQMQNLLDRASVGRLALIGPEGYPYIVPVHFVYFDSTVYVHGAPKGQKIDCLMLDSRTGFEVDEMGGLVRAESGKACNTNTEFESVIITARAQIVENITLRVRVLYAFVDKYTPELSGQLLPDEAVGATTLIELKVESCTGKYYLRSS